MKPSGELGFKSASHCHPTGAVIESSKGHSSILANHLLQNVGEHGQTIEFHEPHFICCEIMMRRNAMWNTRMVEEEFYKSLGDIFGRTLGSGKADLYSDCLLE